MKFILKSKQKDNSTIDYYTYDSLMVRSTEQISGEDSCLEESIDKIITCSDGANKHLYYHTKKCVYCILKCVKPKN